MGLATPDMVQDAWLGPGSLPPPAKIRYWIEKAERELMLDKHELDLGARLAEEAAADPPSDKLAKAVADVVVDMVIRKLQNPTGVRSRSKGTGPFSSSMMFGGDNPGELAPTEAELKKLRRRSPQKQGQISLIPSRPRGWW